jgi:hypothetical protein
MRMRCVGHADCMGEVINPYETLVGNPEEKRPLGGSKHRWNNTLKWNLKK